MSDRHAAEVVERDVRLGQLALVLTALPFVVAALSLIFVVGADYHPPSDHALIEMNIRDVGRFELLKGLYSRDVWSHPGPFFAYLNAPFYRLSGESQITTNVMAVVINAVSVLGMGIVARRRGGLPLMVATLLFASLLVRTLGAEFIQDPWNPYVTVLPYGLLLFLAWGLLCGDVKALLPATVVTTYLAQVHVGFVLLAVPLYGIGVLGLLHHRWRHPPEADQRGLVRSLARPVLVAAAVGAVLWLPTAIDVLLHGSESNLADIARWFRDGEGETHTFQDGWRVVTGQFGLPPEWLTTALGQDFFTGEPTHIRMPQFPWLLGLLAAGAIVLWTRAKGDGRRLVAVVALVLALGILAVQRTVGGAFYYRLRWVWIAPMASAVIVAWAAWLLVTSRWPGSARRIVQGGLVALAVVSAVNISTAATSGTPLAGDSEVLETLYPQVLPEIDTSPDAGVVLVADVNHNGAWYARSLVLELERRGIPVKVPRDREALFGAHRVLDDEPVQARLVVVFDQVVEHLRESDGFEEIASWTSVTPEESREFADLQRRFNSGEIDAATYFLEFQAMDLYARHPAVYYQVSVFRDTNFPTTAGG
jgi:hypothetical protein